MGVDGDRDVTDINDLADVASGENGDGQGKEVVGEDDGRVKFKGRGVQEWRRDRERNRERGREGGRV